MTGTEDAGFELDAAEVVVVGGGAAGAVMAARLSEDPAVTVALLEAGPDFPTAEATPGVLRYGSYSEGTVTTRDFAWQWSTAPAAPGAPGYTLLSGKAIGGGSSINGQVWLRGLPDDFDGWAAAGATGWDWASVEPSFRATETDLDFPDAPAHGHSGPVGVRRFPQSEWHPLQQAFHDGARALGFADCPDLNAPDGVSGVGPQPFNNVDGTRLSSALTYLLGTRSRPNLRVYGNHEATRVLFDGTRAVGVQLRDGDGRPGRVAATGEVVVSAGALGSPWLLLRSGVGPADELAAAGVPLVADVPGVGKNLQEHPRVGVRWELPAGVSLDEASARYQLAVRFTAEGSPYAGDLKISPTTFTAPDGSTGVEMYVYLLLADSRGELRVDPDDPDRPPVVDVRLLGDPEELRRMREGVRTAAAIGADPAFAGLLGPRIGPDDDTLGSDEALDAWMLRTVLGTFHPSSTCAIGAPDDPLAVVDSQARVYGTEGLRVVDASIMPLSLRANLNANVFMLAEHVFSRMNR